MNKLQRQYLNFERLQCIRKYAKARTKAKTVHIPQEPPQHRSSNLGLEPRNVLLHRSERLLLHPLHQIEERKPNQRAMDQAEKPIVRCHPRML